MKTMRKIGAMLMAMLVVCLCAAGALAEVEADYETIVHYYREAINANTTEESLEFLRALCTYYDQMNSSQAQALDAFESGSATAYYTYAAGMVAFEEKDYYGAWQDFSGIQGMQIEAIVEDVPPLPDTTYFYKYSEAMLYGEFGDYKLAFEALETARLAPGASSTACRDASNALAAALKAEAASCCERGDHSRAQSLYRLYAGVNPFEGNRLLSECEKHSQITITSIAALGPDAASVTWSGAADSYLVSWTNDMTGTKGTDSRVVQGSSVVLDGLLPDTLYLVSVSINTSGTAIEQSVIAEEKVRTKMAPKYSDDLAVKTADPVGVTRNEAVLRYSSLNAITDKYNEDTAPYRCLKDDNAFTEKEVNDYALYLRISCRNKTDQAINGSMYCILRSEAAGVYVTGKEDTVFLPSDTYALKFIRMDDLISEIGDNHSSLPKDTYYWELYLDEYLLCKGSFSIR